MSRCVSLSHLTFYVSNAKQAALNWCLQFGFKPFKFRGLETGHRDRCSHAVKLNDIVLVFVSPFHDEVANERVNGHILRHGNSVNDVAINVNSVTDFTKHIRSLSIPVKEWSEEDQNGTVRYARVNAYGSTTHTLVERNNYPGDKFLPNWGCNPLRDSLSGSIWSRLPPTGLQKIDHLALNQISGTMKQIVQWYMETLKFKRFWSKDDTVVNSEHSGLRSIFMVNDDNECIKLTINEPIDGSFKSQIQEFIDYHRGPGVQHIAFGTQDICESIIQLKDRGVQFLETPYTYYQKLEQRLQADKVNISKDISLLHKHNILVDYDHTGHLYQIFTRPIQDRPTVFLELIERHHFGGFGAGNIKALFESIEEEQKLRGNV